MSAAPQDRVGVLVMAYGTPRHPDEIPAYYTHIRRGRAPTPELLADLVGRYAAIGGVSPLAAITQAQVDGVATALEAAEPGRYVVRTGLKHAAPFVEDGAAELVAEGVGSVVGLVLAPHYSAFSIGQYHGRAAAVVEAAGLPYRGVDRWSLEPAYLDFLAAGLRSRLEAMPPATKVLFTAHSLPVRAVVPGDDYRAELRATAEAVAARCGLDPWSSWAVAFQSAGRTPEPWLGPDVLEVIADLGSTGRADGVVVCPCGFVADHLEVLYDLDIEAAAAAEAAGLAFARTPSLNDDPTVLGALASAVVDLAADPDGGAGTGAP